jgi:hypothetical protein
LDWNRWVGPAPLTPFHLEKLQRDTHENITNFSLGMISSWGIHHLDIAQWGNDADALGPRTVEGAPASSRRQEASTRSSAGTSALSTVKQGRRLEWDPKLERFTRDTSANTLLQPRAFRGDWKLTEV